MITRLRPAHSDDELKRIYAQPHDHRIYGRGHAKRVEVMIKLGQRRTWGDVADLSCGNAAVIDAIDVRGYRFKGDIAPGYELEGPLEETINELDVVDLFICGETLEHLNDPGEALAAISRHTNWLLLSTPIDNWNDSNAEHYWSWDQAGVEHLIDRVGFETIEEFTTVDSRVYGEPYCYGIWLVR